MILLIDERMTYFDRVILFIDERMTYFDRTKENWIRLELQVNLVHIVFGKQGLGFGLHFPDD